jgi:adenosylhomocysteine nucleosidase
VVSLGSAGSARLEQTEVYQVTSVSYRDMDASPLGFEKGARRFSTCPRDRSAAADSRRGGSQPSTGGNVVSGTAYSAIDADMVDMETFAMLRACQAYTLPLIGLRGISDGVEELQHISGWTEYLHVIDRKADATDSLFTRWKMGRSSSKSLRSPRNRVQCLRKQDNQHNKRPLRRISRIARPGAFH